MLSRKVAITCFKTYSTDIEHFHCHKVECFAVGQCFTKCYRSSEGGEVMSLAVGLKSSCQRRDLIREPHNGLHLTDVKNLG